VESVVDRVNTTGTVFLGLTVGCCQCHDHKFDPLSQREYYQLFAFFNNADEPTIELLSPEQERLRQRLRAAVAAGMMRLAPIDRVTPEAVEKWERRLTDATRALLPPAVRTITEVAVNGRSEQQTAVLVNHVRFTDKLRHAVGGLANPLPFLPLAHAHL